MMLAKITTISLCLITFTAQAQVSIGKTTVDGNSTLLDFNNSSGNTNGIIIPAVNNIINALAAQPSNNNGTFVFDKSENKIKVYENNVWKNMSSEGSSSNLVTNTSSESTSQQGMIMGSNTSNAKGILVLESPNKTVVIPKIANPHLNVKTPYTGMICYDTTSKSLAVFDGNKWNYWK